MRQIPLFYYDILAPQVRLELTTLRLHFTLNFRSSVDYLINFSFKKLSDARGDLIGLVSSISSLCTFPLTLNHSAGFAQDYHSKFL